MVLVEKATVGVSVMQVLVQSPPSQTIKIDEVIVHPNYGNPARTHDLALVKLKKAAEWTTFVSPPCLPDLGDFGDDSSFPADMECYLSGWGRVGKGKPCY